MKRYTPMLTAFKSLSDISRNIRQIKYERQKLRRTKDMDELSTLLHAAQDSEHIHNLQWTPNPHLVVADAGTVQNVVENCTNPASSSPFTIDTTFNVGSFFVTTTFYKHMKLIDRRTGQHPSLPGPALFHVRENTGQFTYFAESLQEINSQVSDILIIGSDRFRGFSNGFKTICHLARNIVCKKHAEDDIQRKMTDLGSKDTERIPHRHFW